MARGGDDFIVRRAGPTQLDVPPDGVVEQNRFLRDDGDLTPQFARGDVADVHAADADDAALRVVKAQEQVRERGFAGAAGADERDELAGFDLQFDVVQRDFFAVGKMDAIELNVRAGGLERSGLRGSGTEFCFEQVKDRSVAARACSSWFWRRIIFFIGR